MLNYIWMGLIVVGVFVAGLLGRLQGDDGIVEGAFSMAKTAVIDLALPLAGIMMLWLGMLRLAEKAGLIRILARAIRPLMTRLFPDVPADHPAMGSMIMNMAANMLGLGNAATPLGLKAMQELEKLNPHKGVATNAMCTFLAINTSSVTLVPATAIGLVAASGLANPYAIVGPAILATMCSTIVAIVAVKTFQRMPVFEPDDLEPEEKAAEQEKETEERDQPKPVSRRGWIFVGIITVMLAFIAVMEVKPEWRQDVLDWTGLQGLLEEEQTRRAAAEAMGQGAEESEPAPWQEVFNAVSVLVIPVLFVIFTVAAFVRGVKLYEEFVEGAKEGWNVAVRIMPFLVAILVAMGIFRDSGALLLLKQLLSPLLNLLRFPVDLVPMAFMRPLSGSGSMGILGEILAADNVTQTVKYTAATMFGSTETTFYVLAVYFGSVGVRRTRHALAAGLCADAAGVIAAVIICRLMFG